MKAILISIKPKWVAKILNGEKTIEIRKKFPKDYVGWVYIYCTKGRPVLYFNNRKSFVDIGEQLPVINGKVVARFWCDKVEEISHTYLVNARSYSIKSCFTAHQFSKECCLEQWELEQYLKGKNGYAIHITKLEIFDKPKEIKDFSVYSHSIIGTNIQGETTSFKILKPLPCAPQSWCYVEI